ncbi:MAG: efflux RND transporter periplasmic adaptor subunit [Dysgonamonadaceae bacterium]|jgi:RND family efflux transporter MFP subunit|nr:efflux RND transporter periplasmic adaptor subunit [Dysgonamonadaceae bacterium]
MKSNVTFKSLTLALASLLFACAGSEKQGETKETKVKVRTVPASLQPIERISTYTATVEAGVVNQITPATPGRIEKIFVEVGDQVKKGQLLVQMDSSNLRQQNTQLANLERDHIRYRELYKAGGMALQQVDQIKTQIDVLKAVINNINENTKLLSPINGTVTARNYDNGDVFGQKAILTVQQLSPVKALINVSETYFTKVHIGMTVKIKLETYGEETFEGKVTLVYPTIDAASHTFGAEVTINNRDMKVRPGMYARVFVNFGTEENIVVPDRAVIKQSGSNDKYVFTVESGVARYNKVEPGRHIGDLYEIVSGIKAGDIVVIDGHTRLVDGTEVEIIE